MGIAQNDQKHRSTKILQDAFTKHPSANCILKQGSEGIQQTKKFTMYSLLQAEQPGVVFMAEHQKIGMEKDLEKVISNHHNLRIYLKTSVGYVFRWSNMYCFKIVQVLELSYLLYNLKKD